MLQDVLLWLQAVPAHERMLIRKRRAAAKLGIQTKSTHEVVREMEEKFANKGKKSAP